MLRTAPRPRLLSALSLVLAGVVAQPAAAFLIGAPTYNMTPTSTIGTITGNTLAITPGTNGFTVAGQIQVTVPSTTTGLAGILLAYEVDYPIDPAYPFNPAMFTTTTIDGFSTPPPGVAGNTAGYVHSIIMTLPSTPLVASVSQVQLNLVAGVDSPPWFPPISVNSGTFAFTATPGMVLRQRFTLDGIYTSGPGGIWTIDLPVTTFVTLPEPASATVCFVGVTMLARRRQRRPV